MLKMALNINNGELEEESLKSILDDAEDNSCREGSENHGKMGEFLKKTKCKVVTKMLGDSTQELWENVRI